MDFRRLFPDPATLDVTEVAAALREDGDPQPHRPHLALNMVATADGRITIGGRSGPIGNEHDRALFHELRAQADAVMVGAGTLRTERYGPMIRDPDRRARRKAAGLEVDPLAIVVCGSLALDPEIPLFQDPGSHVVVITTSEGEIGGTRARVEYIRTAAGEDAPAKVPLAPALRELRERGVETVLCEGGAMLNGALLAEGLVDELFLVIASKLAGGAGPGVVGGPQLEPTLQMELVSALEAGGDLFLRYRTH